MQAFVQRTRVFRSWEKRGLDFAGRDRYGCGSGRRSVAREDVSMNR